LNNPIKIKFDEGRWTVLKEVICLDTGKHYWFSARTAYEAMKMMKYTLDLREQDPEAKINKTESGRCLYLIHLGKTYSTII
jgi:hypothetical protein